MDAPSMMVDICRCCRSHGVVEAGDGKAVGGGDGDGFGEVVKAATTSVGVADEKAMAAVARPAKE